MRVSLWDTLRAGKQIWGVWGDRGSEIISWWFCFLLPRKESATYLSLQKNQKKQRMMENDFVSECVSLTLFFHIQPCPASCSAGWQPCDRPPSPDRTLCSRTEPAAPLKEAHRPTGRDGDRKRETTGLLPHLCVKWPKYFAQRSNIIWVSSQSKTWSWWLISVRSQQMCWAVGFTSTPEPGCVQKPSDAADLIQQFMGHNCS